MNRVAPDRIADERQSLTQHLAFQRATLLGKLEGLDDESLRRVMTPSGLSLLGLVRHLTVTEHGWLLGIYGGLPAPEEPWDDGTPDAEFRIGPDDSTGAVVDLYRQTCARADELVAAGDLDEVVTTPSGAQANLRAILTHLIQETARHNGHADLMREGIDGVTGA